jgi:hypothetical protein
MSKGFIVVLLLVFAYQLTHAKINTERYHKDYDRYGLMYANSFGFNFASGNSNYLVSVYKVVCLSFKV